MSHTQIHTTIHDMYMYARAASVQEWGCGALANLAMDADNQETIAAEDGHVAILSAMRAHTEDENVLFHGCLALVRLSGN